MFRRSIGSSKQRLKLKKIVYFYLPECFQTPDTVFSHGAVSMQELCQLNEMNHTVLSSKPRICHTKIRKIVSAVLLT